MKDYQVILGPIVTEKTSAFSDQSKYTFRVRKNATKVDIKNAVKTLYGVDVMKVAVIPIVKKVRIGRGRAELTKRKAGKKVIVTLKDKKTLDVAHLAKESKKKK
jgi:large subunit ribosomal protein L23